MKDFKKAIDKFLEYCNNTKTEQTKDNIKEIKHLPYHDLIIYKDGTKEYYYIGE